MDLNLLQQMSGKIGSFCIQFLHLMTYNILCIFNLFVKACRLFCQLVINDDDIVSAHETLLQFCNTFESLYGKESFTPNMHLACHLQNSLLDYDPLAAF